jgi:CheY-like chemotaxis protein
MLIHVAAGHRRRPPSVPPASAEDAGPARQTGRRRILIVEDDVDDVYFIRDACRQALPEVDLEILDNGEQLLRRLGVLDDPRSGNGARMKLDEHDGEAPDMVILDLNMPRISGFEALRRIRSAPHLADLPVMVYSTSSRPEDAALAMALGATRFETKASSPHKLLEFLRSLLH